MPPESPETGSPALQVERALRVVPGVVDAHVSIGSDADAGAEVHLVLADDGDEAVVARAVHRMLRMRFGDEVPEQVELVMDVTDAALAGVTALPADVAVAPDGEGEAEVVDLGLEMDALLADLDRRSGRDFHSDVLAAAVRHPAGAAPTPEDAGSDPTSTEPPRPAIARLSVVTERGRTVVTVALVDAGGEARGTAEGPSTHREVLQTVAQATLRAVSTLVAFDEVLEVAAVSTPDVGGAAVAVVQVLCPGPDAVERLTGASEVRDDVHQAVIRATLDAVNRRLPLLAPMS